MKRVVVLGAFLIFTAAAVVFFVKLAQKTAEKIVKDEALKNALNLYVARKQEGVDFANGPCLGGIGPDWVLDIAHSPRQPVDNQPENQCADFRAGRAHHFVELDPDGKLIQIF